MKMSKTVEILIPESSKPYNFEYFLTHYVFQPWVVEGKELVRLFKLDSNAFILVRVGYSEKPKSSLLLTLESKTAISKTDEQWLTNMISWNFGVNVEVKYFYEDICGNDPVLKAAAKAIYGARLRTDPYVFESVLGVIMAQNVQFNRIYKMNELLCKTFGEPQEFSKKTYYTFPSPQRLAEAELSEIRACKVGYRDKYIKGVAQKIVKEHLNLDDLRKLDDAKEIREKLIELPGVGPYTADLAMAIGFRISTFHLDLYSREALYTFYFKGKHVPDEALLKFVDKRWGKWKHNVMLLLTTNTDTWAKELNMKFRLKSGADSTPYL